MKKLFMLLAMTCILISCDLTGYGPKEQTGGVEVYYQPDALKEQAKSLSEMLDTLGYGKEGEVSFQVVKDSIVHINMVTMDQYHVDTSMDYALNAISIMSSMEIFKKDKVQLHVCDETFTRKRSLEVYNN
ncbi:hypothetical protein [Nonlabens xiamenensis]|uniref:hypothetical protein n=1 Tax=Nonlabens xiamenensis TaxID=2341043 RepID=UPI000F60C08B|nr:hypothetical protein [Nonlabens xiamenensis]